MKQGSTLFLKFVICLMAVAVLAAMVWFPQAEGRAANLDLIGIYTDPFVIYAHIATAPIFAGLYQAFKLLNFIDANKAFSQDAVNALKNIKFAAVGFIGFIVLTQFYIRFLAYSDDPAGLMMLCMLALLATAIIATAAAVFQKLLQNAVDIKSEHDLTV